MKDLEWLALGGLVGIIAAGVDKPEQAPIIVNPLGPRISIPFKRVYFTSPDNIIDVAGQPGLEFTIRNPVTGDSPRFVGLDNFPFELHD